MLSSLAHIFNADVLGAVIQSNISDGQLVHSRYRSVDVESIPEVMVHDAVGVDVHSTQWRRLPPIHVLVQCRGTWKRYYLSNVGGHWRQVLRVIVVCIISFQQRRVYSTGSRDAKYKDSSPGSL